MPRKNIFASLAAIKRNNKLDRLPVIILSSARKGIKLIRFLATQLIFISASPLSFRNAKKLIYKAGTFIVQENNPLPGKENFMFKAI